MQSGARRVGSLVSFRRKHAIVVPTKRGRCHCLYLARRLHQNPKISQHDVQGRRFESRETLWKLLWTPRVYSRFPGCLGIQETSSFPDVSQVFPDVGNRLSCVHTREISGKRNSPFVDTP